VSNLYQRIANLSPEQRKLLLQRLSQKQDRNVLQTQIQPQSRESNSFPASFAQQRLWFLHLLNPNIPLYNELASIQIKGALNLVALEQSVNEIVKRHECLRTTFLLVEGELTQVIHPSLTVTFPVVNLCELPLSERQAEVDRLTIEIAQTCFDLVSGPLLRGTVLQIDEQEHLLLFVIHHIVSDGWSIRVILQELAVLYEAFASGKPASFPSLPIQYADFTVWQRQWLQGEVLNTQLAYWKQQLADAPTVLDLPTDRPRRRVAACRKTSLVQSFQGSIASFKLSPELTSKLKSLSKQQGVTLFMTLLATFQTLLYRYTGQEDICVGSAIANRNSAEIEGLIGFFVNTLVLRSDLAQNPSFLELLNRVRQVCVGAYAHAELPFERLVEELHPERNLSHTPLFQVMFTLLEDSKQDLVLPGVAIKWLPMHSQTAKFDLTLSMVDTGAELKGTLEYSTDLFNADTINRMSEHLQTLLAGIVANPQTKLSDLPLLTASELHQQLIEWNDTTSNYPVDACIHQLFEAQVKQTPDAVAVVFADQQLTYQELNQKANQLAHYLQKLGVGPEVLVGICVERSIEMVIGLLGILKAGGAYLPLDPAYPQERLAFILQDAQVGVLLSQQSLIRNLPPSQTRVVCLDQDWASIAAESQENLICESTPDNLAYIIYTSGSTGQPKGVLVNHTNVIRLLATTQSWYHFNQEDIFTLFHSIAFDFSVWELWCALLYGGQIVVVPYWLSRSPEDFYKLLATKQVTVLNQTPSAFRQLIQAEESLGDDNKLSLRLVIFGGEALELESLRPWFKRHGDQFPQLVNMYGITETTVHVTYRPLAMADLEFASRSVIGRSIPDLQIYLLDQHQQPVPIGVRGEMYVGGAGVARGYLNRAELTAQKFIPNSFSEKPNARLYKTGDLARYLPNGDIEYLGRIDHQVKIRGFRIELGEIENALAKDQAIQEVVVLVRETQHDNKQLVAYVVLNNQQTHTINHLRSFLRERLPEYMVPSAFVVLEALPLTANGKLDHKALPAPDTVRPELEKVFVAPRTPEEKILAQIWAKVLNFEQVGIYDNFFSLGGDSIRSIQVQSLAKEQGLRFSIQQLFQYQTIHELAQNLTKEPVNTTFTEQFQPFALINEGDRLKLSENIEDAYPLTMLQLGMFFHSEYNSESATYHNVSSYHLQAPFNLQYFQKTLQYLANRHPILRTSFDLSNFQEPLQLVHKVVDIPLQVEDISHLLLTKQEELLSACFETEKHLPFDWAKPPLLRFCIYRRSKDTFQFSFTEHHAILDGWSVASLTTELFERYLSLLGEKVHVIEPSPAVNFRNFVALEKQAITSDAFQHYWTQKLSDSTATVLPRWSSQHSKDSAQSVQQICVHEVPITSEVSEGLNQLARALGVPIKSILLAAHMRVLSLLSGQSDIVTGLVCNGRPEEKDGERVLGLFLNTLPYRLQLLGGTWIDLVSKTFAAEQELMPFRRYPLAQLQKVLGRKSFFETAFNYINFHIYQNLSQVDSMLLDAKSFAVTNFTFMAQFSQPPSLSQVSLNLEYDATVLCEQQIQAIGGYYVRTLAAIAGEPEGYYPDHVLLSAQEKNQLLVEWNDTQAEYPLQKCIHHLFEAQVKQTPDAIAVVFEDEQLTYYEVNAKANQLAHYLRSAKLSRSDSLGVKSGVLVGICVERSLEMVIGLLGILKAGGAYVPIDPSYPQERLAFMLEDSQTPILLSQQHLVESLPAHKAQVVCLDSNWELIAHQSSENLTCNLRSDSLAYVIYTSGSTGIPKGAMNTHRGICNRLLWMQDTYQLTAADCVLQKTPFSFDVSVWEFFWPLLAGARLVVARPDGHRDPNYLVNLITQEQITTLHFVPSMLQAFVEAEGLENCKSLKRVICSGEALSPELQQCFFTRLQAELHNLYGPTEAAIDVTSWQCQRQSDLAIVPIGRAIANTQIYILDTNGQPVPIGVPGELHIGGEQLAIGYLNRPELTAEKFIPNAFSNKLGARIYKTGDLARYLPNGDIEYIGRIDHQVKIRGFRIELGEIEAAINQHPEVSASVVIVREDHPGNKNLVAYTTLHPEQTLSVSELRRFLESKLPNHMVPTAFVILEALPLTPNGKVDRRALPAPDITQLITESNFVAPSNLVEKILAKIWAEVLGIEKVGVHNNFFELGGDSIISIQVIAKANQVGLKLTPRQVFEHQTIAELATVASITPAFQVEQGLVTGEVHLTPIEHWFLAQNQPNPHHCSQSLLLKMQQMCDSKLLEQVVKHLIEHHDALRLRFIQNESGWQQIYASPDEISVLTRIDLSNLSQSEQQLVIESTTAKLQASLDLSQGLLIQVALFELGSQKTSHLLITIHNLVVDDVSWQTLLEDLQTAYQQISQGKVIRLPEKTASFKQWAEYLQEYAQSPEIVQERDYWLAEKHKLQRRLPVDYPEGNNAIADADIVSVSLTQKETQALLKEIHKAYNTQINDVLLTALVQAFAKWTGEQTLWVNIESNSREQICKDINLSRTIGSFTNYFPVLLEITKATEAGNTLMAVKDYLRSIPNKGVGYGILRYLNSNQEINLQMQALPEAEVSFNYLGQFDQIIPKSSLFNLAQESLGLSYSLPTKRVYLIEIKGIVVRDQLQFNWMYSKAIHRRETIATLAEYFTQALQTLIAHCQSLNSRRYTSSDFPKANLSQQKLDQFLAKINQRERQGK
jgi:amino acid adenylation domain-containing protein/non-ribosomal peptide synthase protein (TIGR01720 family)